MQAPFFSRYFKLSQKHNRVTRGSWLKPPGKKIIQVFIFSIDFLSILNFFRRSLLFLCGIHFLFRVFQHHFSYHLSRLSHQIGAFLVKAQLHGLLPLFRDPGIKVLAKERHRYISAIDTAELLLEFLDKLPNSCQRIVKLVSISEFAQISAVLERQRHCPTYESATSMMCPAYAPCQTAGSLKNRFALQTKKLLNSQERTLGSSMICVFALIRPLISFFNDFLSGKFRIHVCLSLLLPQYCNLHWSMHALPRNGIPGFSFSPKGYRIRMRFF